MTAGQLLSAAVVGFNAAADVFTFRVKVTWFKRYLNHPILSCAGKFCQCRLPDNLHRSIALVLILALVLALVRAYFRITPNISKTRPKVRE
jgi:hypothetical protein